MATWKFNGITAETLRIDSHEIERFNQAVDVCSVSFRVGIDVGIPWATGQRVVVSRDGIAAFTGFVQEPARDAGEKSESITTELWGNWSKLEDTIFVQVAPATRGTPGITQVSGRRRLFMGRQNTGAIARVTTKQMLVELLSYAVSKGCITGYVGLELIDANVYPPIEECVDRTIAELIRSCMKYHTDVAVTFGGNQTLRFKKRNGGTYQYVIGSKPLQTHRLRPRRDLIPAGVHIRYETRRASQDALGYKNPTYVDAYPLSSLPGTPRVLSETVQLEPDETPPFGLARQYYNLYAVHPIIEGRITLASEECDSGILPGDTVNIRTAAGGFYATRCFVQSVREIIGTGTTHLSIGLPGFLSLDEFLDLSRRKQLRTRDDNDGDPLRVEVPETFLTPYLQTLSSGAWVLRCTAGVVGDGSVEVVPTWENLSTRLDAASKPGSVMRRGASFDVYLRVEFRPTSQAYFVSDSLGATSTEYAADTEGDIIGARITLRAAGIAPSDTRAASIDPTGGAVTSGIWYFRYARVNWPATSDLPEIVPLRSGNLALMHRPPSRLSVFAAP